MSALVRHPSDRPSPPGPLGRLDLAVCGHFNRLAAGRWLRETFRVVSRLGDGVFWYALMLVLPLAYSATGVIAALHMAVAGLAGSGLHALLKKALRRPRPCQRHSRIQRMMAPLDEFSFPSGHTLHAVSFSVLVWHYAPSLAWLAIPFTGLVALSRMVLGLHYPSDVLAGAALGWLIAAATLSIVV
ncbi:MAG: phosphatase PAP2 family protein [Gammaproteobacteria bacterium]